MTKKKVLLIEDNDDICEIVRWVLEEEGYAVTTTGHVPLTEIARLKADVILLDEWINEQAGHMLCKDIKTLQHLKQVPVIIFSTAIDIMKIMKTCGADGYVRKPFEVDELISEINRLLLKDAGKVASS